MTKTVSPSGYLRVSLKAGESFSHAQARAALDTARRRDPDLTHVAVVRAFDGSHVRHSCGCATCPGDRE